MVIERLYNSYTINAKTEVVLYADLENLELSGNFENHQKVRE